MRKCVDRIEGLSVIVCVFESFYFYHDGPVDKFAHAARPFVMLGRQDGGAEPVGVVAVLIERDFVIPLAMFGLLGGVAGSGRRLLLFGDGAAAGECAGFAWLGAVSHCLAPFVVAAR